MGATSTPWPAMPRSVAFVDVETTGLSDSDRLVTLAVIGLRTDALVRRQFDYDVAHLIFDPGRTSHPYARRVHGIPDGLLRNQPRFDNYAEIVSRYLNGVDLVVAHNVGFDIQFINRELALAGALPVRGPTYCTMEGYRRMAKGGGASLDDAAAGLGLARVSHAHDALEDAWLAMHIFLWLHGCPLRATYRPGHPTLAISNLHR